MPKTQYRMKFVACSPMNCLLCTLCTIVIAEMLCFQSLTVLSHLILAASLGSRYCSDRSLYSKGKPHHKLPVSSPCTEEGTETYTKNSRNESSTSNGDVSKMAERAALKSRPSTETVKNKHQLSELTLQELLKSQRFTTTKQMLNQEKSRTQGHAFILFLY